MMMAYEAYVVVSLVNKLAPAVTRLASCTLVLSTANACPLPLTAAASASYVCSVCPAGKLMHIPCVRASAVNPEIKENVSWSSTDSLSPEGKWENKQRKKFTISLTKCSHGGGWACCHSCAVWCYESSQRIVSWLQCSNVVAELRGLACCKSEWSILHSCITKNTVTDTK